MESSSVRESQVNPVEDSGSDQQEYLLASGEGGNAQVEARTTDQKRVRWKDINGDPLAELMVFPEREQTERDTRNSGSCSSCTIL